MPKDAEQRVFDAIHAPLSEFFDAYVIVGYSAGKHDRIVMVNANGKEFRDALFKPAKTASDWYNDGQSWEEGEGGE